MQRGGIEMSKSEVGFVFIIAVMAIVFAILYSVLAVIFLAAPALAAWSISIAATFFIPWAFSTLVRRR